MSPWSDFLRAGGAVLEPTGEGDCRALRVARFADVPVELAAARTGAIVCPLLDWTGVSIAGADAASFLQGQFTNDVGAVAPGTVQLNGFCSPKGRLLANFPLARVGSTEYLLVVPADIAAGIVRRLRMFVLRAKVTVEPLESSPVIGGYGALPDAPAPGSLHRHDDASLIGLPDGRMLAVCGPGVAVAWWKALSQSAMPVGSLVWDALAIRAGMPYITTATQDRFVPQMLNWELLGGVSFRKGCYTGQEIVARMQYLGRLKERLYRGHLSARQVRPGDALYGRQFGEQACGTVVNTSPSESGGTDLLAVLQIASAERDAIRLTPGDDGPVLSIQPLPYDVPATLAAQGG